MYLHYFDHAATTPVREEAVAAAESAMRDTYGNPSSLHRAGLDAENRMTQARRHLASALGCHVGEVFFTSGATESNNLAILGTARARKNQGKKIVLAEAAHPSVSRPVAALGQEGFDVVRVLPRSDGKFYPEDFADVVDPQTILVCCLWVNNETGLISPVEDIAAAVKQNNPKTRVHVDGVQGFCKLPMPSLRSIDLFSISGHKLGAPKGVGALFVRAKTHLTPLVYGGEQELSLRPGTESVPLIAALDAAVTATAAGSISQLAQYTQLHASLLQGLYSLSGITVNSPEDGAPYLLHFSVKGVRSEIMLHFLEQSGFYVSSGSACAKGNASPALFALGIPKPLIDTAIRVSFGPSNHQQEVPLFIEKLKEGIKRYARSHSH